MILTLCILLVAAVTAARAELVYAPQPQPSAAQAAPAPAAEPPIEDVVRLRAALEAGDEHLACRIARRLFRIQQRAQRKAK